jgi:hypothetical protein
LCLLSDAKSFKHDIIGPKCIGKSVTFTRIPETLGLKKAIYIQYNFKAGETLKTQLFNKFHSLAVAKGGSETQSDSCAPTEQAASLVASR